MKRTLYLFSFALLSLAFFACNKYSSKNTTERLHGIWTFDKAKIKNTASINKNVIENFRLSSIKFNPDYTLTYYDAKKELLSTGEWEIYSYDQATQDDNTKTIRDLYIFILDTAKNAYDTKIWKDFDVTRSKLTTTEDIIGGGEYKFELKRIEKK